MSAPNAPAAVALQEETLWDAKDVARYLKASVSWVYKAAERDELPCIHIGAMLRFEPGAIRAWIAACRTGPRLTAGGHQSVTGVSAPRDRGEG